MLEKMVRMKSAIDRLIACYAERLEEKPGNPEREDLLVALTILVNVEEDLL